MEEKEYVEELRRLNFEIGKLQAEKKHLENKIEIYENYVEDLKSIITNKENKKYNNY